MKLFIYFYRLWNGKPTEPSRITYDRLLQNFHWQSSPKRFEAWLKKELESLKQVGGYILDYEVPTYHPRSWVVVHPVKQVMTQREIDLEVKKRELEKNNLEMKEKARKQIELLTGLVGRGSNMVKPLIERFANGDYSFGDQYQG